MGCQMKYDYEFKGLDQGVEHTWSRETLLGGLSMIAKHQPVMHRDSESPFYLEMEDKFPNKTWRAHDSKDGSFRPIFRRSNTWKKIGLIKEVDKGFTLTLIGEQLLRGEIGLEEVFSNVCRNHFENDERPFIIIAELLIKLSRLTDKISVNDIVLLLHNWRPGDDFDAVFPTVKITSRLGFDSTHYSTRKRRVNGMLKILKSMGAIDLSSGEVFIKNIAFLEELVGVPLSIGYSEITSLKGKGLTPTGLNKREIKGKRDLKEYTARAGALSDENQLERVRILEKATQRHEDTVFSLGEYLKSLGLTSYDDPNFYDLYAETNSGEGLLFEVKTVHEKNINKQIREAVSQLYEYRFRCKSDMSDNVSLFICLDKDPRCFLDEWMLDYLEKDRGIHLIWLDNGVFEPAKLLDSVVIES